MLELWETRKNRRSPLGVWCARWDSNSHLGESDKHYIHNWYYGYVLPFRRRALSGSLLSDRPAKCCGGLKFNLTALLHWIDYPGGKIEAACTGAVDWLKLNDVADAYGCVVLHRPQDEFRLGTDDIPYYVPIVTSDGREPVDKLRLDNCCCFPSHIYTN